MEIEVGEYVRTKNGLIDKVQNYSFSQKILHCENGMCIDECNCIGTHLEDIVNHSKNIIDLIEVGDYINENRVYKITSACIYCVGKAVQNKLTINIETILTKEQYMQNCYTVERLTM